MEWLVGVSCGPGGMIETDDADPAVSAYERQVQPAPTPTSSPWTLLRRQTRGSSDPSAPVDMVLPGQHWQTWSPAGSGDPGVASGGGRPGLAAVFLCPCMLLCGSVRWHSCCFRGLRNSGGGERHCLSPLLQSGGQPGKSPLVCYIFFCSALTELLLLPPFPNSVVCILRQPWKVNIYS